MSDIKVGSKPVITSVIEGHGFKIGEIVEVVKVDSDDDYMPYRCKSLTNVDSENWWVTQAEVQLLLEVEEKPTTPQDSEGWIEWKGGVIPVPYFTIVDIRHQDGGVYLNQRAGEGYCSNWEHLNGFGSNIVAYRVCVPSSTDDTAISQESEYVGSPIAQNVSNDNTGASVSIEINVEVKGTPFKLNRDEAYKLYQDLERIFEESIV